MGGELGLDCASSSRRFQLSPKLPRPKWAERLLVGRQVPTHHLCQEGSSQLSPEAPREESEGQGQVGPCLVGCPGIGGAGALKEERMALWRVP